MTHVHIKVSDDGEFYLSARGHASGSETVCAGISTMLFALAGTIKTMEEAGAAEISEFEMESGDVVLAASGDERLAVAYQMTAIGLLQLEQDYGDYIDVIYLVV